MMAEIFKTAEITACTLVSETEKEHMECKAGCSVCCRVNIPVLLPEAIAVKEFIIETKSKSEINTLKIEMEKHLGQIKFMDEEERIFINKKCIFLDDTGRCSIYPVRPLMCRSVTSADASACKDAMSMIALNESIPVPMNIKHKNVMETAFKALAESLKEAGLCDKSREITYSVLHALQH
ncbi:YkgJ family cysteine cluster protein [Deferribacteres bacterium DY0037]